LIAKVKSKQSKQISYEKIILNIRIIVISSYNVEVKFYWMGKPEYPEKTTNLSPVTDKL